MKVRLWRLDGPLLAELTRVAVAGAEPDEVMPPPAESENAEAAEPSGWTPAKERAFDAFHRRVSMGEGATQTTFAIMVTPQDGNGAVRGGEVSDGGVSDSAGAGGEDPDTPGTPPTATALGGGPEHVPGSVSSWTGTGIDRVVDGQPGPAAQYSGHSADLLGGRGETAGALLPREAAARPAPVPAPVDAAEPGEQVVGAARLAPVDGEPGTVEAGLWIARGYRDRGVGRAVLRELRAVARSRGARCLLACTSTNNVHARQLLTEEYGVPEPTGDADTVTVRVELSPVAGLLLGQPAMAGALPPFDPDTAPELPGPLFAEWLADAVTVATPGPQVVTLSTVDADGFPDARVLLLRDVDAEGACWVFASDADSTKGRQLLARPAAALTCYWPQHGRQVRVRGSVGARGRRLSTEEFRTRSPASRVAALVGRQSQPLDSLAEYDSAAADAHRRLAAEPDAVPQGHTIYTLYARQVEFWQGATDRRHVRLRYTRSAPGQWAKGLRWP